MSQETERQKQAVTEVFDTIASDYDNAALRFFPFCADHVVKTLNPRPGQKVLDVATGTGAVAVALAQAVRPGGRVIGVDLSEAMLVRAEANVKKMALDNVDLFCMDAESLEFKRHYFDASVCSFGLFFMPEMHKALKELVRVTKPGGPVLFTSFANTAFQPMRAMMFEDLAAVGVEPSQLHLASDKLTVAQDCEDLLRQAGLDDIHVRTQQLGYHLQSFEDWWTIIWNSGARRLVNKLDDAQRTQFHLAHSNRIQALATDKGIWMDVQVLISSGEVKSVVK